MAATWRLESTMQQQQWCTGYEPGDCCYSHLASARERLLSRGWFCTTCSSARLQFETSLGVCAAHSSWPPHTLFITCSGRTVASASVPRHGTGTSRCFSQFTATYVGPHLRHSTDTVRATNKHQRRVYTRLVCRRIVEENCTVSVAVSGC